MKDILFQKTGITIAQLALDLLAKSPKERISSMSEYQEKFGVSRGTIQNAFGYLKEIGAIELSHHGHLGSYIESISYDKLQKCCLKEKLMGIMPLPYSISYESFAAAIYAALDKLNFNMAYIRGAEDRIQLVEAGTYQFAVVSQYAAEHAIEKGSDIDIVLNFGVGSFLSKHVLVFSDATKDRIVDGMRVAYDRTSLDQRNITKNVIKGKKVQLVDVKMQNVISALNAGDIDVGVWNYDDIQDKNYNKLKTVFLDDENYSNLFSTATIVIKKGDEYIRALLEKYVGPEMIMKIVEEMKEGKRMPNY